MPLRGPRVTHFGRYANVPQRPRILTAGAREPGMASIALLEFVGFFFGAYLVVCEKRRVPL